MVLLTQNTKMRKSSLSGETIFNFGISAYKTEVDGKEFTTCPMAGTCATGCYAQAGAYIWHSVAKAFTKRLELTLTDDFIPAMTKEIATKLKTADRKGNKLVIRIHDSGDFYNSDYIAKWFVIIARFPTVQFYAYTKMVPLFNIYKRAKTVPSNFTTIYSFGGLADSKIDTTKDRHSKVFDSVESLELAGYDNASSDDMVAYKSQSGLIGLVYHGAKSKKWTA